MIALMATALLATAPAEPNRPMSAECVALGRAGLQLNPAARLYTGRHDRRFRLGGQLFLDMRYDAMARKVAVTVVKAPHAPWSFGEKIVERERTVRLSSEGVGRLAITAAGPDVTLECEARAK